MLPRVDVGARLQIQCSRRFRVGFRAGFRGQEVLGLKGQGAGCKNLPTGVGVWGLGWGVGSRVQEVVGLKDQGSGVGLKEEVLCIGTQFSNLISTAVDASAAAA